MTIFLTAISSTIVFILGQISIRFFIEPIQQQRKIVAEIQSTLVFYADEWGNPDDPRAIQAYNEIRRLSGLLLSVSNGIFLYRFFSTFHLVPKKHSIEEAAGKLIGLSKEPLRDEPSGIGHDYRLKIQELLQTKFKL